MGTLWILGLFPAHAGQDAPDQPAQVALADDPIADAARTLLDATLPADRRVSAARLLLGEEPFRDGLSLRNPPGIREHPVARVLLDGSDPVGQESVLRAIAEFVPAPRLLWPVVAPATTDAAGVDAPVVTGAIAAFGTADAVIHLFRLCDPAREQALREAASEAVQRMVGERFSSPDEAWAWYQERRDRPRIEWTDLIRRVQEAHLRSAQARADAAERRLVSIARRLWVRTPEDERTATLDEYLSSSVEPLRALAIELIRERIASGRPIAESTVAIMLDQLDDPLPRVRADAAMLVAQVAPQSAGVRVLRALQQETDAGVAEQLLIAIGRWPSPEAVEPTLDWLGRGGRVSLAAAEAAAALQREGLITDDEQRARLLDALRALDDPAINGGACRLLVELGDETDLARVIGFLAGERASLRLSAAHALTASSSAVDALLEAARHDQNLASAAIRAILVHRRDAAGIQHLRLLESVAQEEAVRAQREILAEIPFDDALLLVRANRDDACRFADDLRVVVAAEEARRSEEAASAPGVDGTEPPSTQPADETHTTNEDGEETAEPEAKKEDDPLDHARFEWASALLECGRAESALQVLEGIETRSTPLVAMRARTLIRLGNLEDALEWSADPVLWLDELARADGQDRSEALAAFMLDRMRSDLSEEQIVLVRSAIPSQGEPTPTDIPEDDTGQNTDAEADGGGTP